MSLPAATTKPRASIRPRISPASRRCTASGLIRMRLRSTAIGSAPAGAPRPPCPERGRRSRVRWLDRRLAIRADLPDRLERRATAHAGLLELRRADGTDEVARVDLCVTHGTADVRRHAVLDRLDLELALAHVLEVLGRAEQHVDERADKRDDQRDERRET